MSIAICPHCKEKTAVVLKAEQVMPNGNGRSCYMSPCEGCGKVFFIYLLKKRIHIE